MKSSLKGVRFTLRLVFAFWERHQKLIIVSAAVGTLIFLYFPKFLTYLSAKNTQKIGLVGKYTIFELPLEIQNLIGDGLTKVSSTGEVSPSLAASWDISPDGKEYLFTLRDDAFWHNGKPVLSADINYNFNDVASLEIDQKKIKFVLKEAFVPFPAAVSHPVFLKGLIGTGSYEAKKIKKNGQVVETLLLKSKIDKSKPSLLYRFYPSEAAARIGFKLGEIDILRGVSDLKDLAGWKKIETTAKANFNQFAAIYFDTGNPKFANKSVRQALAYSINKHWEPRAINSINPRSWSYNSNVKQYSFDLDKAKNIINNMEDNAWAIEEIELSTVPSLLPQAEEIKTDWQKLEIKVSIKILNNLEDSFETLLVVQESSLDPDQYFLWHSTQASNISHNNSPKIDKLLEEGRKTFDQGKRKEIYFDFQRFLVEDTPAIFLFHPTVYTATRKRF